MAPLEALRAALTAWDPGAVPTGQRPSEPTLEYALWRFLRAWAWERGHGVPGMGPDAAVLLRQVLRWGAGPFRDPRIPVDTRTLLGRAGVELTPAGRLSATPYSPHWADGDRLDPEEGMDRAPRRARTSEPLPGEEFLLDLGRAPGSSVPPRYTSWQSAAQKEAVWRVLNTPPGGTCLVVLPTGTGKSLVFQLLADASPGLTVVVVPTIALAIDQWQAACNLLPGLNPLYYEASADPEAVVAALTSRTTRLLFTSPEACVSGRLRGVLQALAEQGQLDNLVVDEVHLVDTWGAYFRVDFQMLSGVRKTWLEAPGARLRTLLLTATLTPRSCTELSGLFQPSAGSEWWQVVSQRLRPEMTYFDRRFGDAGERDEAVRESLWRLPRPAILYVTERRDAEDWFSRLTNQEGFRRVGCFHGDTRPSVRRELLGLWRADDLDLMVATSAFGLGVDKPDVRSVVHACFPEDMNRYYQEVGRGGRDGWSATCLLLPTGRDEEVAFGLCPKRMTVDLLKKRWRAMWDADSRCPVPGRENVWLLDLTPVRQGMLGRRTGRKHVLWNKRLLLQLQRAGAIELRGVRYEYSADPDQPPRELIEAELKINPTTARVAEAVESPRREELEAAERGLRLVGEYLRCRRCIARLLAGLYGEETQLVCGGCRWCRREGVPPRECPRLEWHVAPPVGPPARVTLVGEFPDPFAEEEAFARAVRGCMERRHVRRFATGGPYTKRVAALIARTYARLPTYLRRPYRVDSLDEDRIELLPGETLVVFHPERPLANAFDLRGGDEVAHWYRPPTAVVDFRNPLSARGVMDLAVRMQPEDWFRS